MKYTVVIAITSTLFGAAPPREARTVRVSEKTTVTIDASVLQSTLLVLPEDEKIMTVFEGDKENWMFESTKVPGRFLSVKPKAAGVTTDVHIISDHGNSYSFVLREASGKDFDSKVFLEPDESLRKAILKLPEFVPAAEIDKYRKAADAAKADADHAAELAKVREQETRKATDALRAANTCTVGGTSSRYRWDQKTGAKLGVMKVCADDKFTYIRANPLEAAAVYEIRDGKPSLINWDFANGLYTMSKHVERGYLAIGKTKMDFWEVAQ
ncbi:MAG: hypothetical protein NVS9B4_00300 [Candidatus Acidiferrum sp.]